MDMMYKCFATDAKAAGITSGQVESREVAVGSADHATKPAAQSFSKMGMGQERDAKRAVFWWDDTAFEEYRFVYERNNARFWWVIQQPCKAE